MRTISNKELDKILEKHEKWLSNEEGGERANLSCINLQEVDLRCVDLQGANLQGANLISADLYGADLSSANLHDALLRKANLRKANLKYTDLSGADLQSADLQSVDLYGADLSSANLREANLTWANLINANLINANLMYANLKFACLQYAHLNCANLHGTGFQYADLENVYREWLVYMGPLGSRRSETLYFADYDNVQCGCWNNYRGGTLAEFKARIDDIYPADDKEHFMYRVNYLSAIKAFESMRETYSRKTTEDN
jgi:hypothetical protein